MPDDLSPLKQANFTAALNDFDELLTQSGKAFLLGAGCSKCAGVPLTAELTAKTLESELLNQTTKEILVSIEKLFEGAVGANIEDYLSELVDLVAIAERRGARGATIDTASLNGVDYSATSLKDAVDQIKKAIVKVILITTQAKRNLSSRSGIGGVLSAT